MLSRQAWTRVTERMSFVQSTRTSLSRASPMEQAAAQGAEWLDLFSSGRVGDTWVLSS